MKYYEASDFGKNGNRRNTIYRIIAEQAKICTYEIVQRLTYYGSPTEKLLYESSRRAVRRMMREYRRKSFSEKQREAVSKLTENSEWLNIDQENFPQKLDGMCGVIIWSLQNLRYYSERDELVRNRKSAQKKRMELERKLRFMGILAKDRMNGEDIDFLIAYYRTADFDEKESMVEAVFEQHGKTKLKFWLEQSRDREPLFRSDAAGALREYPCRASLDKLKELAEDKSSLVRGYAIGSIGLLGDRYLGERISFCRQKLAAERGKVRADLYFALTCMGEDHLQRFLQANSYSEKRQLSACIQIVQSFDQCVTACNAEILRRYLTKIQNREANAYLLEIVGMIEGKLHEKFGVVDHVADPTSEFPS